MPAESAAVLGIDAAWTPHRPSGVALVVYERGRWRCVQAAASYAVFCGEATAQGAHAHSLCYALDAASQWVGRGPDVVAVDMPLARDPITARRAADNLDSRRFGGRGCATHTPGSDRPGPVATNAAEGATHRGYTLQTHPPAVGPSRGGGALIEVYPHVALLALMGAAYRVPYKATKTRSYWPEDAAPERLRRVVEQQRAVECALATEIDDVSLPWPATPSTSFASLKPIEDMLDALICAWVGILFLDNRAVPLGDEHSAIWIPDSGLP